jgi:hypothetical protein
MSTLLIGPVVVALIVLAGALAVPPVVRGEVGGVLIRDPFFRALFALVATAILFLSCVIALGAFALPDEGIAAGPLVVLLRTAAVGAVFGATLVGGATAVSVGEPLRRARLFAALRLVPLPVTAAVLLMGVDAGTLGGDLLVALAAVVAPWWIASFASVLFRPQLAVVEARLGLPATAVVAPELPSVGQLLALAATTRAAGRLKEGPHR